jgi:hypothetical protein
MLLLGQYPPDPKARGSVEGAVVDQSTGLVLRRVQVILRPGSKNLPSLGAMTDDAGRFTFSDLPAGRYSLVAKRPGYLPAYGASTANTRLPLYFPLLAGERLNQITIRMRSAGVVSGAVKFIDAEPAIGVRVEMFREYFRRGQHGYERVAEAFTDDRGAYRIYGLPPGEYYLVAVCAPPDPGPGVREQTQLDSNGVPVPEESFVTTYYPSTPKLIEASPVTLRYGLELTNTDVTLAKARTVRARGRLISGVSGEPLRTANIRLRQRAPAGDVMVDAAAAVRATANGFEITGLTPGFYLLVAEATENRQKLTGRLPITVAGTSINDLEIILTPYPELKGVVSGEGDQKIDLSKLRVSLEPVSDTAPASSATVRSDGSFTLPYVPGEAYDVFLLDTPPEIYLKSARVGGLDVLSTGFKAEGGELPPMELVFSAKGAVIEGEVADGDTRVALGAMVVLVPDPARGRVQQYQATSTNEYGLFQFTGVAPGHYTLASWWDEPPCDIYDLESLDACRRLGKSIDVGEAARQFISVPVSARGE